MSEETPNAESEPEEKTIEAAAAMGVTTSMGVKAYANPTGPLENRRNRILERYEDSNEIDTEALRSFTIFAHAVIEEKCAKLIRDRLITRQFEEDTFDYFYSRMSQSHREELLAQAGMLNGPLTGRLDDFRALRNKLAHQAHTPLDWDEDKIESRTQTAIEIIEQLHQALVDQEEFEKMLDSN